MKVIVDRDKCTALGNCEAIAEEYFSVDDEGRLQLLREEIDEADLAEVKRAVSGCPMAALTIAD